jgi:hypothetical protein
LDADIEAAGSLETHLIGINPGIEQLTSGESARSQRIDQINTYSAGAKFCNQVARAIHVDFIAYFVLTVASMRVDNLRYNGFVHQLRRFGKNIFISGICSELAHLLIGVSHSLLDHGPNLFIDFHFIVPFM